MGLFDRLFKKDPDQEMEKARALLADGLPVEALHIAERLAGGDSERHRAEARELALEARRGIVASARERSAMATGDGNFEDAIDWLEGAVEQSPDESVQAELRGQLEELRQKAAAAEVAQMAGVQGPDEEEGDEPLEAAFGEEMDAETHFDTLVGMLADGLAERYEERPEAFRDAFLALNEGRAEEALPTFEEMADAQPSDPILRLERGRCRLLLSQVDGAREDFEAAWAVLGDEPLDLAGTSTIPALWAEACLGQKQPQAVIDRLEEQAAPERGNAELSYRYGLALVQAERLEDARTFFGRALAVFPSQQVFSHHLALVLDALGERRLAIDCLETAIAPSCATGSCARPPRHLPSLRKLAALYLEDGQRPERARQLVSFVAEELKGHLQADDLDLLGRFYEQTGNAEEATQAQAQAQSLREESEEASVGLESLTGYRLGQNQGHRPI